jgi:hypothetical protein
MAAILLFGVAVVGAGLLVFGVEALVSGANVGRARFH